MKRSFLLLACAWMVLGLFAGCLKDSCRSTYKVYIPVLQSLTQVRAGMKSAEPKSLAHTGKLYLFGQYIFLNEENKGIHVIDNSNPAAPRNISFISIPGNVDLAVQGHYLYADSYSDMVVFDISNPRQVQAGRFLNNVFEDRNQYYWSTSSNPDSVMVVVGYEERDTTMDCSTYQAWVDCANCMTVDGTKRVFAAAAAGPGPIGMGGSMARFALVNDHLYSVTRNRLKTFGLANPAEPQLKGQSQFPMNNIETIYPFGGHLFIGSSTGMFIYDIANPSAPAPKGQFSHVRSCDPVIADQDYAYVTLRSGTACNGNINQMEVLDISNLRQPSLVKTYPLTNPHGLSKDGNTLFVCDGKDGLKVYDASDVRNLKLLKAISGLSTYDVITLGGMAIVVAEDGLYQYDYSDLNNIRLLSKLAVSGK